MCAAVTNISEVLWLWMCVGESFLYVFKDEIVSFWPHTWVPCCSLTQSCPKLCNPMDCSTPGFPVLHCLLKFAQTHVYWVNDATQPSYSLSPPSPLAIILSQHQSFPVSQLFSSGGQSIGASALVLPMNIQSWFPLGLTGLISLQSKGLSRVFSSTTVWKHQFFSAQSSLCSNPHICTWLLKKP